MSYIQIIHSINSISKFGSISQESDFNRKNVIDFLKTIESLIECINSEYIEEDGVEIIKMGAAQAFLSNLIAAFGDLDAGKTDDVFKPIKHGSGATHPWKDRQTLEMVLFGVKVLQARGVTTDKNAVLKISEILKEQGYRLRGKPIDAKKLLTFYGNRCKYKTLCSHK
jgi:hypothetical protein